MLHFGYKLSSEEFGPSDLIRQAAHAEAEATRDGHDHVCLHHVGPEQEGFIRFFEREIRPRLRRAGSAPRRVPAPRRRAA
jgi:hypothetical protein